MGLLDIFKKKKPASVKTSAGKKPERKIEKKATKKAPAFAKSFGKAKPAVAKALAGKRKKSASTAYKVLLSPHVTEKATELGERNKYVFKVRPNTNKIEIKKGVESLYGVDVVGVNIINIHRKKRRVGRRREGWKKGYKKAIVKVKKGQKIEVMPR